MAQAKLESGHFTSHIFKKNHNLFGMKFPRQRKTTAIGANKGHSLYTNWKSSVLDYKLWQDAMIHRVNDEESYLLFLKKRYASDPTYVKQLKIMLNENNRI